MKVKCDVTQQEWDQALMRRCKEPNVTRQFWHKTIKDGKAYKSTLVCYYVCQRCKYHENEGSMNRCIYGRHD